MISLETALAFFVAAVLLAMTPGPDNILVVTQSALKGRLAGIRITLGLSTGIIVHTTAVALGLAAILQQSPLAFDIIKYAGAAYLAWLAFGAARAALKASSNGDAVVGEERGFMGSLYLRGVISNVTNPKVTIFCLAFLPQFIDPAQGGLPWQFAQLGFLFILATLLVFGSLALMAGSIGERILSSQRGQRVMNAIAACVFAGLAMRLATSKV